MNRDWQEAAIVRELGFPDNKKLAPGIFEVLQNIRSSEFINNFGEFLDYIVPGDRKKAQQITEEFMLNFFKGFQYAYNKLGNVTDRFTFVAGPVSDKPTQQICYLKAHPDPALAHMVGGVIISNHAIKYYAEKGFAGTIHTGPGYKKDESLIAIGIEEATHSWEHREPEKAREFFFRYCGAFSINTMMTPEQMHYATDMSENIARVAVNWGIEELKIGPKYRGNELK